MFIITEVIIEILALSLAENGVIFCYIHLPRGDYSGKAIFQNVRLVHCHIVSEEEINLMKGNAISRNTKHVTKFGITLFKGKM